jgi:hypothetical protein
MSAIKYWDGTKWVTLNTTGATGAQGPRGDKGDTGADGPAGSDGVDGADGKDGSGVTIKGTANAYPPDATPTVGDMWLVADPVPGGFPPGTNPGEGLVWDGTSWVNVGSIRGPKGEVGADGADGATGADGAPGADGQGFTYKGEFVAGPDYDNYDVVTYNGASYVQIASPSSTNDTPDLDPTAWQLLASGGADGAEGPRGPNCYVQVAEPVAGGVGELWIDPDAVAEGAAPALLLQKATPQEVNSSVYFKDTSGTAGPDKTMVYIEAPAGSSGLVVGGGGNIVFGGPVVCNTNLTVNGNIVAAKGAIAGEAVNFPAPRSFLNADVRLTHEADNAGRRDRIVLFLSDTAGAHRITVPTHSSQPFDNGWQITIVNTSETATPDADLCEIVADAGVWLRWGDSDTKPDFMLSGNAASKRLRVRNNYGRVTLTKVSEAGVGGAGVWIVHGDAVTM